MNESNVPAQGGRRAPVKAQRVLILGAGRMGADIALAFGRAGWHCEVVEAAPDMQSRARRRWRAELRRLRDAKAGDRMRLHAALADVPEQPFGLVVEAVFEDLKLKHRLLAEVEARVGARTIIATNTSGLRISDVMRRLARPQRAAGLHFMVPAHVMLAVEITRGEQTSAATMRRLTGWMKAMGKVPLVLERDAPAMLINRIQHAMYREISHLIDTGAVSARAPRPSLLRPGAASASASAIRSSARWSRATSTACRSTWPRRGRSIRPCTTARTPAPR
ncbi:MAG TPA: 3-hydroxyacyl-CoA dehydrogenase family protein [Burkholderiaceae bacterium]|nr:3-hydroxyacyl-CoA dehydrogenase family protein [Burkholderiaceae bacterium]